MRKPDGKVCSRGHTYRTSGACPVCYPGRIKKMPRFVALLRGINVGGNNVIKMTALRECFERMGFADVSTYIQSGNVIFRSPSSDTKRLASKIEKGLSDAFRYVSKVVVLSEKDLARIAREVPEDFGREPEKYRYDVIFLRTPLTGERAMRALELRDGVDTVYRGANTLYFKRLTARATQSKLRNLIQKPEYQEMTIRNWNTTVKLLGFLAD